LASSPSASPSASATTSPTLTSSGGIAIIDIYAGGLGSAGYGFGTTTSNIASPGPTINLKVGDQVTINFHNNSQMGHRHTILHRRQSGHILLHLPSGRPCELGHVGRHKRNKLKTTTRLFLFNTQKPKMHF
jgi:hypothetical protein